MSAPQRHREALAERLEPLCALKRLGPCRGRLQAHHIIERQRLQTLHDRARIGKRIYGSGRYDWPILLASLDDLIADARNGLWLCEWHHPRAPELTAEELPESVYEFASDYDLLDQLPDRGWLKEAV